MPPPAVSDENPWNDPMESTAIPSPPAPSPPSFDSTTPSLTSGSDRSMKQRYCDAGRSEKTTTATAAAPQSPRLSTAAIPKQEPPPKPSEPSSTDTIFVLYEMKAPLCLNGRCSARINEDAQSDDRTVCWYLLEKYCGPPTTNARNDLVKNCLHDQSDGFQATEEGSSESVDSTGDYEHRHKRVVSDPPPLESWHTTGKL